MKKIKTILILKVNNNNNNNDNNNSNNNNNNWWKVATPVSRSLIQSAGQP